MKLALHRSITFWSGILVISFIAWAWLDSWKNQSAAGFGAWGAIHEAGGLLLVSIPWSSDPPPPERRKLPELAGHPLRSLAAPALPLLNRVTRRGTDIEGPDMAPGTREAFIMYLDSTVSYRRIHYGWLYLPYGFLLFSAFVPWTALLLFRAKGRRKSPPGHGSVPSEESLLTDTPV